MGPNKQRGPHCLVVSRKISRSSKHTPFANCKAKQINRSLGPIFFCRVLQDSGESKQVGTSCGAEQIKVHIGV